MARKERSAVFYKLRHQHSVFTFDRFYIDISDNQITCTYHFDLNGDYLFTPELKIPYKPFFKNWASLDPEDAGLRTLFFHIGMVELISYWKAACPAKVIIKPYALSPAQLSWWKNLYFHGLGEFFYLNGLDPGMEDFMEIETGSEEIGKFFPDLDEAYLVPVGGGKDSAVSLEMLRLENSVRPMLLNPRMAMFDTLEASRISRTEAVEFYRTIDPGLLRLNEMGYLNGHTPFSALLAFQTLLAAYLCGHRNIALSNEGSANESTIPGTSINHQYSKTYTFEKNFREYVADNISPAFNYFSFLRPLKELQIAELFSRFPNHYYSFRSCNSGSKTDSWCGACPKCLFAWVILSPFLGEKKLEDIFGKKLLDEPAMWPFLEQLSGQAEEKPFECIGTIEEVKLAIFLIRQMAAPDPPPMLIARMDAAQRIQEYTKENVRTFFETLDPEHFLSTREFKLLKDNIVCPKY